MDKGGEGGSSYHGEIKSSDNEFIRGNGGPKRDVGGNVEPRDFFDRLAPEEQQLLLVRETLYDGSWEEVEKDLRHRLDRKPHIFRLVNRIKGDLARIERIRTYEINNGVDLGVFLEAGTDDNI